MQGNEKFSFVTNVRIRADGELLLREPNQTSALVDQKDLRTAMKDLPGAHTVDEVDRTIAKMNLSKGKLKHSSFYRPWVEEPATQKNASLVRQDQTEMMAQAQPQIIARLGAAGKYNKHLAVILSNQFNPTALGYKTSDPKSVERSINRMKRLQIERASLYMVVFEPEQRLDAGNEFWKSVAFYLRGCYRMNEFLKHADFMSENRFLSHSYKFLMEDVLLLDAYSVRYPEQDVYFDD